MRDDDLLERLHKQTLPDQSGAKLPWASLAEEAMAALTTEPPKNTFHILRGLVAECQCKPGWTFSPEKDDETGGLVLWITVPGVDSFDPSRKFTVRHPHPVPATTFNTKSWRRWIMDQCLRTETHELGEWLRFGVGDREMRPFLPTHGPGEDPYALREYRNEDDAFTTQNGQMRGGVGPSGRRLESERGKTASMVIKDEWVY